MYGLKAALWKFPYLVGMGAAYEIILAPADPSSLVAAAFAHKLLGY